MLFCSSNEEIGILLQSSAHIRVSEGENAHGERDLAKVLGISRT